MGRPKRSEQFSSSEICIVHAVQRCVRRAFLAGVDDLTGKDYSFRRETIRRRMEALASVFAIDVLTYAVMSNHLHVIVRNRPDVVATWSDEDCALRWLRVFPGRRVEEFLADPVESDVKALAGDPQKMEAVRSRLSDISWFMRALAEPIARVANRQDECTGRFWEGRFKAQRIEDEAGLLACAMYVDLNPIRAAMVESPDQAVHTSAYDRIQAEKGTTIPSAAYDLVAISTEEAGQKIRTTPADKLKQERKAQRRASSGRRVLRDSWLAPLTLAKGKLSRDPQVNKEGLRASDKGFLDMGWSEYIELLRWTARQKSGVSTKNVPPKLAEILTKVGIDASMWRDLVWNYKRYFGRSSCAGTPQSMAAHAERHNKHWHPGQRQARAIFIGK
jgi:hypothetical protein